MPVTMRSLPSTSAWSERTCDAPLTPAILGELVAAGGRNGKPFGRVDDVARVHLVLDRRRRGLAEARAEHRDERDERDADHQRGGGRRGAARVADRVRAGQLAGDAADAARRSADEPGERADQPRRDHAPCRRTAPARRRRAARPRPTVLKPPEQTRRDRRERDAHDAEADLERVRGKRDAGSVEPSRTAAIGGTRVARRAGRMLARTVTSVPTMTDRSTRARRDRRSPRPAARRPSRRTAPSGPWPARSRPAARARRPAGR